MASKRKRKICKQCKKAKLLSDYFPRKAVVCKNCGLRLIEPELDRHCPCEKCAKKRREYYAKGGI